MKNIILPTSKNNFYPHILRPLVIGAIFIVLIGVRFIILFNSAPTVSRASDLTLENILNAINNERSLRNIGTLKTDSRLSAAAQSKTDDMQARHYFSHTDPEGNYIWNKIVAAGYTPYSALGENLAIEFYNTESLVAAWMNSPTHRANVLNEIFKDQGMGMTFGDPNKSEYHSAIANTFGALTTVKSTLPEQTPVAKKSARTSAPKPTPTPKPTLTPTPTPTPTTFAVADNLQPASQAQPLNVRAAYGTPIALNSSKTPETLQNEKLNSPASTAPAVVGTENTPYQQNRLLNLGLASLLVILLLADLKLFQKERYPNLDKKLNNLSLVIVAIILTALLYWL